MKTLNLIRQNKCLNFLIKKLNCKDSNPKIWVVFKKGQKYSDTYIFYGRVFKPQMGWCNCLWTFNPEDAHLYTRRQAQKIAKIWGTTTIKYSNPIIQNLLNLNNPTNG